MRSREGGGLEVLRINSQEQQKKWGGGEKDFASNLEQVEGKFQVNV